MSSRAFRRLQQDVTVVKIKSNREEQNEEEEEEKEEEELIDGVPGFTSRTKRTPTTNPFALLVADSDEEGEAHDDDEEEHEDNGPVAAVSGSLNDVSQTSAKKRKKKKKKSKQKSSGKAEKPEEIGTEDVDTAIREVNELLGESQTRSDTTAFDSTETLTHRALLSVDRRFLNAENEMRRIFGSRVVRAEAGRQRAHRRVYHRSTVLTSPQDSWPKMDRPGLSMKIVDSRDGWQCFEFEHSQEYQRVQTRFWEAVETFDPNAIGMVLNAHPYHIDSLLQLSEVCKMTEDVQMAAELIERALYCFECSFHTFFNFASGTCRLSYKSSENRSFFIALFRHLCYIGRRGCHRTALEFCKLLLSLDPEGDPLGVLLMIDYYAIRAGEYRFIINLFREWEGHRNLSQLPNFAFSIPLALFHSTQEADIDDVGGDGKGSPEADVKLQEALITFPSLLIPLLDKCSVTLDPTVMRHSYFSSLKLDNDPKALQLLEKLYIERSHSLWKEPEVLTWLEENARRVIARADSNDPLVDDATSKRQRRYVGTPRNIYRHVIMSDFDNVAATLPRELSETPILMYDPLPPLDSTSSYQRPERAQRSLSGNENPIVLFLRSLLPTFNPQGGPPVAGGDNPYQNPAARQLHDQLQRAAAERNAQRVGEHGEQEDIPPGAEGNPGQPLDLQATLDRLFQVLQQVLDLGHHNRGEGENSEEENQ